MSNFAPYPDARFDLGILIGAEIYEIMQRFGAQSDLLAVIGSWGYGEIYLAGTARVSEGV